jgi:hypothetical protein
VAACRTIEELKSKVATLQEGLTLLLSAQALPADAAAALTATLCKGGVLSSEQLAATGAGVQAGTDTTAAGGVEESRGDDLEEVISAINRVSSSCLVQHLLLWLHPCISCSTAWCLMGNCAVPAAACVTARVLLTWARCCASLHQKHAADGTRNHSNP